MSAAEAKQLHAAAGLPVGTVKAPGKAAHVVATTDPAITKLNNKLQPSKNPHRITPCRWLAWPEAALFVNAAKGKHGTTLDYSAGKARDLKIHERGNPNVTGAVVRAVFSAHSPCRPRLRAC